MPGYEEELQDRGRLRELREPDGGAAKDVEGVKDCVVNYMTLKMSVEFAEGADPADVMQKVSRACKRIEPDCEIYI